MRKSEFEKINNERKKKGEKLLANPRNATAGTIKLLDIEELNKRSLSYYAYTLILDNELLLTQEEGIKLLEREKISISKTYKKCNTINEILQYINYWKDKRHDLEVDIDGIVIKINNLKQQKVLGSTSKSPRWAIAYKYKPENISTKIISIDFQVGRIGTITPVANLEPVLLSGTIVKRASLHNFSEIKRLDIKIGDKIFIEKGGEIIPKVTGVDKNARKYTNVVDVRIIKNCPDCNTMLVMDNNHKNYYCPNYKKCPTQIKSRIIHFASRDAMDIKELGSKTVELLYNSKLIKDVADLYDLEYSQIYKLEGFKELSTKNLLNGIKNSKNNFYNKIIYSLGIKHVGKNISRILSEEFENIDKLKNASLEDLNNINEIGEIIAKSINDFFLDQENILIIERLKNKGLKFQREKQKNSIKKTIFNEKKIVISGTFKNFEREKLKNIIIENGGKVASSVSKNIDYFIIGKNPGPEKIKKSKEFNIETIDEVKLMNLLSQL